jgi:hypothetical protein
MQANFQSVQTFTQTGRSAADLVWGLRDVYVSLKSLFGKAVVFIPTLFGVGFLRLVLWFLIRKLKKNFSTSFDVTPDNYKSLKIAQTALSSKIALLVNLKQVNAKNLPFLLRGVFGQTLTILTIVENYNTALENQLTQLDKWDTGDSDFEVVAESALWAMRTTHYDYRF